MIRQPTLVLLATALLLAPAQSQDKSTKPGKRRNLAAEIPGDVINDVDQAAVALHPATPYLEDSTMLLGEIDLRKVDVEATGKWWREILIAAKGGGAEGGRAQYDKEIAVMRRLVQSLRDAGVRRFYATAATRSSVDGGPLVIVPCDRPDSVGALVHGLLKENGGQPDKKIHQGEEIVLVGPSATIDRVVASEGAERPDLILPLRRDGRLDHHVVISLPEEARRELIEFWPDEAPAAIPLQFSPRKLARDLSRITFTWRLPPRPEMVITLETIDADAAVRIEQLVKQALALGGDLTSSVETDADAATVTLRASTQAFAKIRDTLGKPMRRQADRRTMMTTMKQIGLAIHNYAAVNKQLPRQSIRDDGGERLLSVRVALLPYIEQQAMQREMRMDEAWNSPHNQRFSSTRIPLYCETPQRDAKTRIRFPVYPGSLWDGDQPKSFRDVADGTSNTIAAIHAPESAATEWANPAPWMLSQDDPMSDVFGDREEAIVVLLDGAALVLDKASMTNDQLKAMLTIAGGEAIKR